MQVVRQHYIIPAMPVDFGETTSLTLQKLTTLLLCYIHTNVSWLLLRRRQREPRVVTVATHLEWAAESGPAV